jgi:hypothetical protein
MTVAVNACADAYDEKAYDEKASSMLATFQPGVTVDIASHDSL